MLFATGKFTEPFAGFVTVTTGAGAPAGVTVLESAENGPVLAGLTGLPLIAATANLYWLPLVSSGLPAAPVPTTMLVAPPVPIAVVTVVTALVVTLVTLTTNRVTAGDTGLGPVKLTVARWLPA